QKLNTLICCLCNQIASNAMELQCDEHENSEHIHLIGEDCLQKYLKQNNGKCPVQHHDTCNFAKSKTARQQISELLVICPLQYEMNKYNKSNKEIKTKQKGEFENELNLNENLNLKSNFNDYAFFFSHDN
ncbi:hypothetical protein RFI_36974, partial [Reticulomyxa filosa]